MMSMCRAAVLCYWKRVFAMTGVFCWQNSASLCPASFCNSKAKFACYSRYLLTSTFAYRSSMMKRTSFFFFPLVLVLGGLVSLYRIVQLQLLWHYWLGDRLGLLWCWMVYIGNELRSFCCFWDCIQELHFGLSLLTIRASPFLLSNSCPQS